MIEIKRDPKLLAFYAVLIVVVGVLVWHQDVTWQQGGAFLAAALGIPNVIGTKKLDASD